MITRSTERRKSEIGTKQEFHTKSTNSNADRPVRAYLPEDLDLTFIAPGRRDAASYFVGRLYLARYEAGKDPERFQELYSPLLQALIGTNYRGDVVDPLLDNGVIEEDSSYSTGWEGRKGYSKSFRLTAPFRHGRFRSVALTHSEFVARLRRGREQATARRQPVHRHLEGWFDRLTVAPGYPEDVLPLRAWAEGQTRFEPCRYGRLHSNLTNLARVYRRHLSLEGVDEPLVAVDLKTSQPLLLGLTLRDRNKLERDAEFQQYARERAAEWERKRRGKGERPKGNRIPYVHHYSSECQRDIGRYIDVCLTGDLYSTFVADTGYTRDQLKKYVLTTFYGTPWHASGTKTGQAFQRTFPGVWEAIASMSNGDQSWLPCLMQTVESWLVIWRACGRLARELPEAPLLTIHDCLVTTERYVELVRRTLLDEFHAVWGVRPQTDTKALAA